MSIVIEEAHTFLLSSYQPPLLSVLSQPGMSIVSYLSLCLSPLGVVHVGTAAYTCCLERGWGGRKQDDSKKASLFVYVPHDKSNQSTILLFLYGSSLCVQVCIFIQLASQNMKSARLSVYLSELGPLIRKRVLLPPFGSKRGDTLACGGGREWGTKFRRRNRHSETLGIY